MEMTYHKRKVSMFPSPILPRVRKWWCLSVPHHTPGFNGVNSGENRRGDQHGVGSKQGTSMENRSPSV